MDDKRYVYLVSYNFDMKEIPEIHYKSRVIGRMLLVVTKQIETNKDIISVERMISEELQKEFVIVEDVCLLSFSLMRVEGGTDHE